MGSQEGTMKGEKIFKYDKDVTFLLVSVWIVATKYYQPWQQLETAGNTIGKFSIISEMRCFIAKEIREQSLWNFVHLFVIQMLLIEQGNDLLPTKYCSWVILVQCPSISDLHMSCLYKHRICRLQASALLAAPKWCQHCWSIGYILSNMCFVNLRGIPYFLSSWLKALPFQY